MPAIRGLLESSLYVADAKRARDFYADVMGLPVLLETARLTALDAGRGTILLLFPKGAAEQSTTDARGIVPGHGGQGRLHVAFAIGADELDGWRAHLRAHNVAITGEYRWPRGGVSLYFEDPDGHVLELATPGLWPTY